MQSCNPADDNDCTTTDTYLSLPGGLTLTLSPTNPDPNQQTTYSIKNFHGDTALTVGASGTPTSSVFLYEPFGQPSNSTTFTTNSNPTNATDQPMGWATNPNRKVQGTFTLATIQMGARVYLPTAGRFLQVDPVEGGTLNSYTYVNDPINMNDYSGQWGVFNWVKEHAVAVTVCVVAVVVVVATAIVAPELLPVVASAVARIAPAVAAVGTKATRVASKAGPAIQKAASKATSVVSRITKARRASPPPVAGRVVQTTPTPRARQVLQMIDRSSGTVYRSAPYGNKTGLLPKGVNYTEHDLYPFISRAERGLQRIVTGDDGSAWYTIDHYTTFIRMR